MKEVNESETFCFTSNASSLANVPIRFSPLPLGGFKNQMVAPLAIAMIKKHLPNFRSFPIQELNEQNGVGSMSDIR